MFNSIFWKFRRPIPKAVVPGMRQRGVPGGCVTYRFPNFRKSVTYRFWRFRPKKGLKRVKNGVLRRFQGLLEQNFSCGAFGAAKSSKFYHFGPKMCHFSKIFGASGAENLSLIEIFRRLRRRKPVTYRFQGPPPLARDPPIASLICIYIDHVQF